MKSILKKDSIKTTKPTVTFEDYFDERIRMMQKSANEYFLFLKQVDDLITRIDLTMENMRTLPRKKTVCFTEHNEVFLIPPREITPQQTILSIDFQNCNPDKLFSNLFY